MSINFFIAFLAGLLSFLSPCILPIIPSFLGYISGISIHQNHQISSKRTWILLLHTTLFSIGFLITFLILGAVIGALGQFLIEYQSTLQQIGGVFIIFFGIQSLGLFTVTSLQSIHQFKLHQHLSHHLKSFLTGIIFAFSWSPCYGPILGSILTLAASSANFSYSLLMFLFYGIGFLIPLYIMTIGISYGSKLLHKNRLIAQYSKYFAGILLIMVGLLLLTNSLSPLVNWLDRLYIGHDFYNWI